MQFERVHYPQDHVPPRHYAWWLHGSAPDVPPVIDGQWTYTAATIPATQTRWLTENLPSSYHGHLRLKVTTFNVNTLRHVGSTELLRKQCHQAGIRVLGLQETRATCDVT